MDWIVTEVDGKVASIAADYRHLPLIASEVAALPPEEVGSIGTRKIDTEDLIEFAHYLTWEDLRLFGSPFQINVWKKIFEMERRLHSYSELAALVDNPETEWRVTEEDLWQHREYKRFMEAYDDFMEKTDDILPWHILDGSRRKTAVRDAMKLLAQKIQYGLDNGRYVGDPFEEEFPLKEMPKLAEVDLSPSIDDEEYKKELKRFFIKTDLASK